MAFDAADPHSLAAWWADLLGYAVEDGHDAIAELLATGAVGEDDVVRVGGRLAFATAAAASDPDGRGPRLYFQRVPESKVAKNRCHLDVLAGHEDLESEVDRLTAAGATLVGYNGHPGARWAVMQDPEGNEFCLT